MTKIFQLTAQLAGLSNESDSEEVDRANFQIVDTEYGKVVAFENIFKNIAGRYPIVPGFYIRDIEPEHGLRMMEVQSVGNDNKEHVKSVLKSAGYEGVEGMNFWYE